MGLSIAILFLGRVGLNDPGWPQQPWSPKMSKFVVCKIVGPNGPNRFSNASRKVGDVVPFVFGGD